MCNSLKPELKFITQLLHIHHCIKSIYFHVSLKELKKTLLALVYIQNFFYLLLYSSSSKLSFFLFWILDNPGLQKTPEVQSSQTILNTKLEEDISNRLKGKTLDEIISNWNSQIDTCMNNFHRQAVRVMSWDRPIFENSYMVSLLILL